ncbi:MAG: hypothetical protein IT306_20380 [Chloroflexi bacterium]|nr:hypothetical protein [Chloroflexota bacterium]
MTRGASCIGSTPRNQRGEVLGGVQLGISESDVRELLGEPDHKFDSPVDPASDWIYGSAEVAFQDGSVIAIRLRLGDLQDLPEKLCLTGYLPKLGTRIEEFLAYVRAEKLSVAEDTLYSNLEAFDDDDKEVVLVVGGGVDVWFVGTPPRLNRFLVATGRVPLERLRPLP